MKIFHNTHEAIVDVEMWQLAHRLKKTIRKPSYPDCPANPLTGLLYCADCGCKMPHHQSSPTKEKVYDVDDNYGCSRYRQLTRDCTITAQAGDYFDCQGRSKSAESVGGAEQGTGTKSAAYAPGEGYSAGRK